MNEVSPDNPSPPRGFLAYWPLGFLFLAALTIPLDARFRPFYVGMGATTAFFFLLRAVLAKETPPLRPLAILGGSWLLLTLVGFTFLRGGTSIFLEWWVVAGSALITGGCVVGVAVYWRALRRDGLLPPAVLGCIVLLGAYFACFSSRYPEASFHNYFFDGAGFHLMLLALALAAFTLPGGRRRFLLVFSCLGGIYALIGLGIVVRALNPEHHLDLMDASLIRDVHLPGILGFRLQFPQFHHNRLAYYGMLVGFAALAAMPLIRSRWLRWSMPGVFVAASCAMFMTQTRVALIAWLAGAIVLGLSTPQLRRAWHIPVAALLLVGAGMFVSSTFRDRVQTIVDPATYYGEDSPAVLKRMSMTAALEGGLEQPLLGRGYGWTTFRRIYGMDYQSALGDPERKQHAHNSYLEVWSATGALPFLALLTLHGWAAVRLWRRRRHDPAAPALLALLTSIFVFGLANTTMHYAVGGLTWILLALFFAPPDEVDEGAPHGTSAADQSSSA